MVYDHYTIIKVETSYVKLGQTVSVSIRVLVVMIIWISVFISHVYTGFVVIRGIRKAMRISGLWSRGRCRSFGVRLFLKQPQYSISKLALRGTHNRLHSLRYNPRIRPLSRLTQAINPLRAALFQLLRPAVCTSSISTYCKGLNTYLFYGPIFSKTLIVSDTSNRPQNDVGNPIGLYVTHEAWIGFLIEALGRVVQSGVAQCHRSLRI